MNIGVFDSGLGGLTVLKSLIKKLPEYHYIYYGDNARVPYGNRSKETIYKFTKEAIDFLASKNCQLIIIACNTSTSTALKKIQNEYLPIKYPDKRVLCVIKPAVEYLKENNYKKIGIVGTKATISSEAYIREIKKLLPTAIVFQKACPLLVPYIEDSSRNKKVLDLLLDEYLTGFKNNIDALLLACTHYEIIEQEIKATVGNKIEVISQGKLVAEKLLDYLRKHPEIESQLEKTGKVDYFFSDSNSDFKKLMKLFLDG